MCNAEDAPCPPDDGFLGKPYYERRGTEHAAQGDIWEDPEYRAWVRRYLKSRFGFGETGPKSRWM
jgi:hypothetical protein